jgi:hypothetical protein
VHDATNDNRRYEDYLDSQITPVDMYYLEDIELARHLVELGCVLLPYSQHEQHRQLASAQLQSKHYDTRGTLALRCASCRIRGNGEVIKREEFDQRKEAAELARQARLNKKPKKLVSAGKNVETFPFLQVRYLFLTSQPLPLPSDRRGAYNPCTLLCDLSNHASGSHVASVQTAAAQHVPALKACAGRIARVASGSTPANLGRRAC